MSFSKKYFSAQFLVSFHVGASFGQAIDCFKVFAQNGVYPLVPCHGPILGEMIKSKNAF